MCDPLSTFAALSSAGQHMVSRGADRQENAFPNRLEREAHEGHHE
jgi:hypothetical protein